MRCLAHQPCFRARNASLFLLDHESTEGMTRISIFRFKTARSVSGNLALLGAIHRNQSSPILFDTKTEIGFAGLS